MDTLKRDKRTYALIIIVAVIAFLATALAWFTNATQKDVADVTGNTRYIGSYFAAGSGTAADPYIISEPEHLKNLAWLQYLGYFNKYVDNDSSKAINTVYFKVAASDSSGAWNASTTLNMNGWVLPPIGTTKYPFVGNFDGNGSTIKNLKVRNSSEQKVYVNSDNKINVPSIIDADEEIQNVRVIGFFGVTGDYNGNPGTDKVSQNDTTNEVKNITLDHITVQASDNSLAGLAVGYMNCKFTKTLIAETSGQSEINCATSVSKMTSGPTNNLSDYSLVGYATSTYTGTAESVTEDILKPSRETEGTGGGGSGSTAWGGSLNMNDLSARLDNIREDSSDFKYSSTATIYEDKDGNITRTDGTVDRTYDAIQHYHNQITYPSDSDNKIDDTSGSVAFTETDSFPSYLSEKFHILYGENSIEGGVKITTTKEIPAGSFEISDGSYYMNINDDATAVVSADITSFNNTLWKFTGGDDDSGLLTTTYNDSNIYLKRNSDGSLSLTTDSTVATYWYYIKDNKNIYCVENGVTYYLVTNSGVWTTNLSTSSEYIITDLMGNYMKVGSWNSALLTKNRHYSIDNTTSLASAARWTKNGTALKTTVPSSHSGFCYLNIGGILDYCVRCHSDKDTIIAGSDYIYEKDEGLYITYKDDSWTYASVSFDGFRLWTTINGVKHYLKDNDDGTVGDTTDIDNATIWESEYTETGSDGKKYPSGSIYNKNDDTHQLYLTNNGELTISTSYDDWNWNSARTGLYAGYRYKDERANGYLYYDGSSWTIKKDGGSDISFDGANYPKAYLVALQGTGKIVINAESTTTKTTTIENGDFLTPDTYFPIITSGTNDYYPTDRNPGYFISGANSDITDTVKDCGDMIISTDYFKYRNLTYSNNGNTTYSGNESQLQVVTKNAKSAAKYGESSGDSYVRISDFLNSKNLDDVDSALKSKYPKVMTVEELGLIKYDKSRTNLGNSFSTASYNRTYGFHFKEAFVGMDNIMIADSVKINGETKYDYQLPRDCVDFTAQETGYINFFGGSYYEGNNSFFSVNQVIRKDDEITDIKTIDAIYENKDYKTVEGEKEFIYLYEDGTYSEATTNSSGTSKLGDKLFDSAWITNVNLLQSTSGSGLLSWDHDGALYYFEVPVNGGDEFALGAAKNCVGSYILYLDIGASPLQATHDIETYRTETNTYKYPMGVDFLPKGQDSTTYTFDVPNAAVSLSASSAKGRSVYYSCDGDSSGNTLNITNKSSEASGTLSTSNVFADAGVTVKEDSTAKNLVDPVSTSTYKTKRSSDASYNADTKITTKKVVTMYDTESGKTFDGTHNVKTQVIRIPDSGTTTEEDPVYSSSTEAISFDENDIVITYDYMAPDDTTVSTTRTLADYANKNNVIYGQYKIEVGLKDNTDASNSRRMHLKVKTLASTFAGSGDIDCSTINSTNMSDGLWLLIKSTTD